jgi:hypothetical protein
LTGYGVPDHDMPDSFPPPTWGPPFDERALDALLSGYLADTPPALRQVADALTALCAAPTPAELTGEAAARAEFRALAETLGFGLDEAVRTDGHPYAEVLSALAMEGASRPPARHRSIRGARGAGGGGPARPHRARPPGRRLNRRGGVLVAVAGAAVIMALISLTGSLPGPIHPLERFSAAGKSSPSPSANSGSQNVQARSAARDPSPKATLSHSPSVTHSASALSPAQIQANEFCRALYVYFLPSRPHVDYEAEIAAYQKVAQLAGDPANFDVNNFCGKYVQGIFPHGLPQIPPFLQALPLGPQNDSGNGQPGEGNASPTPAMMSGKPGSN